MKTLIEFFRRMTSFDKVLGVFVLLGLMIVFVSLFRGVLDSRKFELVSENVTTAQTKKVLVDVSGAVVSPGVYELPAGSRIKDALILAGGFSLEADRDHVSKYFNLAEIIKDGQKLYIPFFVDTGSGMGYSEAKIVKNLININTASVSDLDTLWGIGESRANDIVKNRPYMSLEEMLTKKVVTKQILEKNKERMTVY